MYKYINLTETVLLIQVNISTATVDFINQYDHRITNLYNTSGLTINLLIKIKSYPIFVLSYFYHV